MYAKILGTTPAYANNINTHEGIKANEKIMVRVPNLNLNADIDSKIVCTVITDEIIQAIKSALGFILVLDMYRKRPETPNSYCISGPASTNLCVIADVYNEGCIDENQREELKNNPAGQIVEEFPENIDSKQTCSVNVEICRPGQLQDYSAFLRFENQEGRYEAPIGMLSDLVEDWYKHLKGAQA